MGKLLNLLIPSYLQFKGGLKVTQVIVRDAECYNCNNIKVPFSHTHCCEFLKRIVYVQEHLDHVMPLLWRIKPVGSTMPDELADWLNFAVFNVVIKSTCDWRSAQKGQA